MRDFFLYGFRTRDGFDKKSIRSRFFTEENPLGVVGSYIEDRIGGDEEILSFKNHYIMNAYDTEILEAVLKGIHEKRQMYMTPMRWFHGYVHL